MMWFAKEITTDKEGFISEVPPAKVVKDGRKWNFSFLYNKNSSGGIYNNDSTRISDDCRGYFCCLTLIRDNTIDNKYNTVNPAKQIKYNETDFFIFKYQILEQSGFTGNL